MTPSFAVPAGSAAGSAVDPSELIWSMHSIGSLNRIAFEIARRTSPDVQRVGVRDAGHRRPIVLQTPWMNLMSVANGVRRGSAPAMHMLLCRLWREARCGEQRAWIGFLRKLQRTLHRWVRRKHDSTCAWSDMLQTGEDGCVIWRLACHDLHRLPTYDAEQQRSTSMDLRDGNCYSRFILHLEHVWINDRTHRAGAQFRLLQAQHSALEPLEQFSFVDAASRAAAAAGRAAGEAAGGAAGRAASCASARTANSETRLAHAVYGKFFRMLSVGIPRPGVEQKMRMANLDPSVLDTPLGAPLPACDASAASDVLGSALTATRALRKCEPRPDEAANKPRFQRGFNHGISLQQIKERLGSLRRIVGGGKKKRRAQSGGGSGGNLLPEAHASGAAPEAPEATPCNVRGTAHHSLLALLEQKHTTA